jgi:hypothetical protein
MTGNAAKRTFIAGIDHVRFASRTVISLFQPITALDSVGRRHFPIETYRGALS